MNFILAIIMTTLTQSTTLSIKSNAFAQNGMIPSKYTCQGENINPDLSISGIPGTARSLAIIMEDPDATNGTFDHWVMWNIPVNSSINENSAPGLQGKNGRKENKYTGPCPPAGTGIHHYHFKVYALDISLDLPEKSGKKDLEKSMEGHIVGKGELIGLFENKNK